MTISSINDAYAVLKPNGLIEYDESFGLAKYCAELLRETPRWRPKDETSSFERLTRKIGFPHRALRCGMIWSRSQDFIRMSNRKP